MWDVLNDVIGNVGQILSCGGIDDRRCRSHFHDCLGSAHFEHDIASRQVPDLKCQSCPLEGFKTLGRHGDRVRARGKIGKPIVAA